MRLLDRILNRQGHEPATSTDYPRVVRELAVVPQEAFYPPQDLGLPVVDPESLLDANEPLLQRLQELTVSDASSFKQAYLEPIRRLAKIVQLLPASSSEHYSGTGGLFKLCLELGFYSLQSADGKIFTPDATIEERHKNEPRWRYATFLAALTSQVYRSLTLMSVIDESGSEWPRFTNSLTEWLNATNASRYYVKWHSETGISGGEGASVMNKIAPADRLDWLSAGDVQILRDMHQVAMGASHQTDSIMAAVVLQVTKKLLEVDESVRRSRYGKLTCGMHLEPYLLDALRCNIESRTWLVNSPGSPVWYGSDGLFIEWPAAHKTAMATLREMKVHGIPGSALTYAEVLGKSGVTIQAENGLWVREILIPEEKGGDRKKLTTAMRFVDALTIFGHTETQSSPYPYGAELVRAEQAAGKNLESENKTDKPSQESGNQSKVPHPAIHDSSTTIASQDAQSSLSATTHTEQKVAIDPVVLVGKNATEIPSTTDVEYSALISPQQRRWIKSADVAESVGQLIHHHKNHRGEIAKTMPYGVALSVEWLATESASDISQFIKIFEQNKWLGRPPNVKNEAVKLHDVQFDDGIKKAIVLSTAGAKVIGFIVGEKK